jgi:Gly-Xaa carboxypeptidase
MTNVMILGLSYFSSKIILVDSSVHALMNMEKEDAEKQAMTSAKSLDEPQRDRGHCVAENPPRRSRYLIYILLTICLSIGWLNAAYDHYVLHKHSIFDHFKKDFYKRPAQCRQVAPLVPKVHSPILDKMDEGFKSEAFMNASIKRLSSVVQIPTESFDDMGPLDEDTRWDIFFEFADLLKSTFPLIHSELKLEKINTHGLLYTWQGEDPEKKPLLLMAHQDVVPVAKTTVDAWTHPPFSGFYDGKYIWGRGASDCKNSLVALMETIEELLGAGFKPKRTVVLSFGFDEEISGQEGAGHLAPFLLERYGNNGIAAIVDEGAGFSVIWGSIFATPGVGEKGYTDVDISVRMPGGHSSIPPAHTSIGVLSELITHIEADTYRTWLAEENPYLSAMQCGAAHSPDFPKKLKKLLPKHSKQLSSACSSSKEDKLAIEAAKQALGVRYLMQTSIAVDVISGGVKVNALPEKSVATVNHRINIGETPELIKAKSTRLAKEIAKKYNLTLHAFTNVTDAPSSIVLSLSKHTLEVAPVTPSTVDSVTPYSVLAGTTRALYGEDIIVAPGIMSGNTDTRFYWNLSRNIFRWNPGWIPGEEGLGKIHTVDERQSVAAHINAVRWFSRFVRNMDEADLA